MMSLPLEGFLSLFYFFLSNLLCANEISLLFALACSLIRIVFALFIANKSRAIIGYDLSSSFDIWSGCKILQYI